MKLFRRRQAKAWPVRVEPVEWEDGDRVALAQFCASPTGTKLLTLLRAQAYEQALTGVLRSDFDQGRTAGLSATIGAIEALADTTGLPGTDQ